MPERPDIWLVMHDEELVAELAVERVARPWRRGTVTRHERFGVIAPLVFRDARLAATIGTTPGGCESNVDVRRQLGRRRCHAGNPRRATDAHRRATHRVTRPPSQPTEKPHVNDPHTIDETSGDERSRRIGRVLAGDTRRGRRDRHGLKR